MWLIDQMYSQKAKKKSATQNSWAAEARQYNNIKNKCNYWRQKEVLK